MGVGRLGGKWCLVGHGGVLAFRGTALPSEGSGPQRSREWDCTDGIAGNFHHNRDSQPLMHITC